MAVSSSATILRSHSHLRIHFHAKIDWKRVAREDKCTRSACYYVLTLCIHAHTSIQRLTCSLPLPPLRPFAARGQAALSFLPTTRHRLERASHDTHTTEQREWRDHQSVRQSTMHATHRVAPHAQVYRRLSLSPLKDGRESEGEERE